METPDPKDSEAKLRTLQLSSRDVHLLLKYGYPFPEAEQPLRESRGEHSSIPVFPAAT